MYVNIVGTFGVASASYCILHRAHPVSLWVQSRVVAHARCRQQSPGDSRRVPPPCLGTKQLVGTLLHGLDSNSAPIFPGRRLRPPCRVVLKVDSGCRIFRSRRSPTSAGRTGILGVPVVERRGCRWDRGWRAEDEDGALATRGAAVDQRLSRHGGEVCHGNRTRAMTSAER